MVNSFVKVNATLFLKQFDLGHGLAMRADMTVRNIFDNGHFYIPNIRRSGPDVWAQPGRTFPSLA